MTDDVFEPLIDETKILPKRTCRSIYKPQGTSYTAFLPLILFVLLCNYLDSTAMNLALPKIQEEFGVDRYISQWLITAYSLAVAATSIPLAKLADSIGQVYAMYIYLTGLTIGYIAIYFIKNLYAMCALRFFIGACFAGATAARMALIRLLSPPEKAQVYMMYTASICTGFGAILPFLASFMINYNWRLTFLLCGIFALCSILALIPYTNPPKKQSAVNGKKCNIDFGGMIAIIVATGSLDLSFTFLSAPIYWLAGTLFGISIIAFVSFYFIEMKVSDPILPLKIMKTPVTEYAILTLISSLISTGISFILAQYAAIWGQPTGFSGLFMSIVGIISTILTFIAPLLTKRYLNKTILIWTYSLSIIAFAVQMISTYSFWFFVSIFLVAVLAFSIPNFLIQPIILCSVPLQYAASITAIPNTCRQLGSAISLSITSMILKKCSATFIKQGMSRLSAFNQSVTIVYGVYLFLIIVSLILLITRTGQQRNESNKKGYDSSKIKQLQLLDENEEATKYV
ncbi:Major_facilitator superfamily protein [Hexamita inflata]|uniref:Major_facilitator superfamily protein n=1 Tax=Hexamita inflata TaxID=28002 RepID=A0ABP1H897_9EUKA